jgi:hypothetical protein
LLNFILPATLEAPLERASDWNTAAWIIWWSLTVIAVVMYMVGIHAVRAYSSRIPAGVGMAMTGAGYIFLLVAATQMSRNSPDGQQLGTLMFLFAGIAIALGISTGISVGDYRWGVAVGGVFGLWTAFWVLTEVVTRIGLATGLAPALVIGIFVVGCIAFYAHANRR